MLFYRIRCCIARCDCVLTMRCDSVLRETMLYQICDTILHRGTRLWGSCGGIVVGGEGCWQDGGAIGYGCALRRAFLYSEPRFCSTSYDSRLEMRFCIIGYDSASRGSIQYEIGFSIASCKKELDGKGGGVCREKETRELEDDWPDALCR